MKILVHHDGQQLGPYSLEEVRAALASGTLLPSDLGWQEGTPDWVPLNNFVDAVGAPHGAAPAIATTKTSGFAISSFVLGLLCLPGILAVIFGHVARSQIRRSGGAIKGMRLAMTGLVLGYLSVAAVFCAIVASLLFPILSAAHSGSAGERSLRQARWIAYQCKGYANDHGGRFPNLLSDLVPDYVQDEKSLTDPGKPGSHEIGYLYFGTGRMQAEGETKVLLESKAIYRNKKAVAYFNGSADLVLAASVPTPSTTEPELPK